jgi:hypothetical protein
LLIQDSITGAAAFAAGGLRYTHTCSDAGVVLPLAPGAATVRAKPPPAMGCTPATQYDHTLPGTPPPDSMYTETVLLVTVSILVLPYDCDFPREACADFVSVAVGGNTAVRRGMQQCGCWRKVARARRLHLRLADMVQAGVCAQRRPHAIRQSP